MKKYFVALMAMFLPGGTPRHETLTGHRAPRRSDPAGADQVLGQTGRVGRKVGWNR